MAVEFKDNSFVVTFETGGNPIEDWLGLHDELLLMLSVVDANSCIEPPRLIYNLLSNMMPDWETALKMKPRMK